MSLYRLVRVLLDEVLTSTIGRCVDPVLMEQSVSTQILTLKVLYFVCILQVVELICEKS